jgi:hypothetical protein
MTENSPGEVSFFLPRKVHRMIRGLKHPRSMSIVAEGLGIIALQFLRNKLVFQL